MLAEQFDHEVNLFFGEFVEAVGQSAFGIKIHVFHVLLDFPDKVCISLGKLHERLGVVRLLLLFFGCVKSLESLDVLAFAIALELNAIFRNYFAAFNVIILVLACTENFDHRRAVEVRAFDANVAKRLARMIAFGLSLFTLGKASDAEQAVGREKLFFFGGNGCVR